MEQRLDLERYPLDDLHGARGKKLVGDCRRALAEHGMFDLEGFVGPRALADCIAEIEPVVNADAFTHRRSHNIYFDDGIAGDHAALKRFDTVNHTICADQIPDSMLCRIYAWPPLAAFLAATMGMAKLYAMADPLACVNVLTTRAGEALNWHFDRSEFTVTMLLQASESGGEFQYRRDLRSDSDANLDGVGRMLDGRDDHVQTVTLNPGALNVFKGKYAAHRVTPVVGARARMVAVFCYYEKPGVVFSDEERLGFYGRSEARAGPASL